MLACIMDTLRQFHAFGFKVSLLIVDGASSNLSALKSLMGVQGVFGHDEKQEDPHYISAFITNPFSGEKMHLMICPSHQVRYSTLPCMGALRG